MTSQPGERGDPETSPCLSELPPQTYPRECKERTALLSISSETFSLLSLKVKYLAHAREYMRHDQEMNLRMCTQPSTLV